MLLEVIETTRRCSGVECNGSCQSELPVVSNGAIKTSPTGFFFQALDGFLFVLNAEGTVEFVSPNVEKYLRCSQVRFHVSLYALHEQIALG